MFEFIYRPIKFIYRRLINFIKMQQQKLLPPSVNYYEWLVAENNDNKDQILYNIHDLQCRIPELAGKRIRGCFHGWVILSNHHHTHWFLWNPAAANSTLIRLPHLKDVGNDRPIECYLSSPPYVPGSILLLARKDKPEFVFCRLDDRERKSPLRWITMSYAQQLSSITGRNGILQSLTYCNGDLYAAAFFSLRVVKIHIVVTEKSVMIRLLPFVNLPKPPNPSGRAICSYRFLIGSSLELLVIYVGVADMKSRKPVHVCLLKLDTSRKRWVEKEDLKDTVLYMEMVDDGFSHAAVSEFGGYIHFLHVRSKVVYSYNVRDKTISMSFSMRRHLDLTPSYGPEFRLESDVSKADGKCKAKEDAMVVKEVVQEEEIEADDVVNPPFDVLEAITEYCVGVEYLNFRATCKICHLAAPLNNRKVPQRRLKTYSLVSSPWLMLFDRRGGIITFTDPMFGENYFIRAQIVSNSKVAHSRYGWLLLLIGNSRVAFFNPFTSETRELPARMANCQSFCFSAPPTSPDCMVVGFSSSHIFFHFVAGAPIRRPLVLGMCGVSFECPTFCGRDVYALRNQRNVGVFREVGEGYQWEVVVEQLPTAGWSAVQYFLTTCNQHLLLLMVGDFGEGVEVFKLTKELEWEKMDRLGRHVIYVCEASSTCLCMAAKAPEMENKILFSRLHSKNGKVMFYSMETRRFHTFDGRNVGEQTSLEDFYQHTYNHAWIEPTWR